jgi:hypothetical protein
MSIQRRTVAPVCPRQIEILEALMGWDVPRSDTVVPTMPSVRALDLPKAA